MLPTDLPLLPGYYQLPVPFGVYLLLATGEPGAPLIAHFAMSGL